MPLLSSDSTSSAATAHIDLQAQVFEQAAALFAVLATPVRLRVLSALCVREKSVNELLLEIDTTQPNLSQHLAVLHRSGVLAKRKEGTQVIYRVQNEQAVALCRSVCTQIAIELNEPEVELDAVPASQSLSPRAASGSVVAATVEAAVAA